jgi:hypothetical protein
MTHTQQGCAATSLPSYTIGFNSIGAFTVAFSNHTGMTPSAFARKHSRSKIAEAQEVQNVRVPGEDALALSVATH